VGAVGGVVSVGGAAGGVGGVTAIGGVLSAGGVAGVVGVGVGGVDGVGSPGGFAGEDVFEGVVAGGALSEVAEADGVAGGTATDGGWSARAWATAISATRIVARITASFVVFRNRIERRPGEPGRRHRGRRPGSRPACQLLVWP
jgi:hypothetical protein